MRNEIFLILFFHLPLALIFSFLYVKYAGKLLDKVTDKLDLKRPSLYEEAALSLGAVVLIIIYLAIVL